MISDLFFYVRIGRLRETRGISREARGDLRETKTIWRETKGSVRETRRFLSERVTEFKNTYRETTSRFRSLDFLARPIGFSHHELQLFFQ